MNHFSAAFIFLFGIIITFTQSESECEKCVDLTIFPGISKGQLLTPFDCAHKVSKKCHVICDIFKKCQELQSEYVTYLFSKCALEQGIELTDLTDCSKEKFPAVEIFCAINECVKGYIIQNGNYTEAEKNKNCPAEKCWLNELPTCGSCNYEHNTSCDRLKKVHKTPKKKYEIDCKSCGKAM